MTDVLTGRGPVAQERRLVTEVPGPRSRELLERRTATVASGVGLTLPVFVERAAGGVIVDVDGNSLIDLGSGIAVVNVGNAAPRGGVARSGISSSTPPTSPKRSSIV